MVSCLPDTVLVDLLPWSGLWCHVYQTLCWLICFLGAVCGVMFTRHCVDLLQTYESRASSGASHSRSNLSALST